METGLHRYVLEQIKPRDPFFSEMERVAKEKQIPIIEPDSLHVMLEIMQIQSPRRILEIGTAIGYSCLRIQQALPEASIVTIERDENRFQEANNYLDHYPAKHQITSICGDALLIYEEVLQKGPFDAIFIDAAKSKYRKFFQIYTQALAEKGIVYIDNVLFKGLGLELSEEEKKKARIAKKMREFNAFLNEQTGFSTMIVPLGDGLAISRKVKEEF